MTLDTAPALSTGKKNGRAYPDPETMLGTAWQRAWDILDRVHKQGPTAYMAATDVADYVTATVKVQPVTVANLLGAAYKAGVLDKTLRKVQGPRGPRHRAFYRIKATR